MNKKHSQRVHAKRRAFERFGIQLNRKDLFKIGEAIRKNKAQLLERQSKRVTMFLFPDGWEKIKTPFKVAYDGKRHQIMTVIPYKVSRSESETSKVKEKSNGTTYIVTGRTMQHMLTRTSGGSVSILRRMRGLDERNWGRH